MAIAANSRRQYQGGAQPTTLATRITALDTTIQINSSNGWPTGLLPAAAIINPDQPTAEVIYFAPRNGLALLNCQRGADGTSSSAHEAGEQIILCLTAQDLDEANKLVNDANTWTTWSPTFYEHPAYPSNQRPTPAASLIYAYYKVTGKECGIEVAANLSLKNGVGPEFLMSLPIVPARTGDAGTLRFQNQAGHLERYGPEEQEASGFLAGKASLLKFDHSHWLSDSILYRLNIKAGYAIA